MKLYNHFVLLLSSCLLSLFFVSCSGYRVIHITDSNKDKLKNKNGFYYNLPQTALKVDVIVRHTSLFKGPYTDYAEKYLAVSNIIKQDGDKYEIADVHVSSISRPDPLNYYFVRKTCSMKKNSHLAAYLSDDNSIIGFNIRTPDENIEKESKVIGQNIIKRSSVSRLVFSDNLGEKVDTIIEKYKTDTISIERKIYKKVAAEKTSEIKAKEAADYLLKIKDNRFNILTGSSEVNYSEGTIKYMKEQLDREEQKYLSLFTGDSSSSIIKYSFVYIPQNNAISEENALFNFSSKEGIVKTPDSNTETVAITVENKHIAKLPSKFQLKLDSNHSKKYGFFYRIPDYGKVTVRKGKTMLAENEMLISQFGFISHLPLNLRKAKYAIRLGSIKGLCY